MNINQQIFYDFVKKNLVAERRAGLYLLDSPAGTGKTYTITHIFKTLNSLRFKIQILCPTHKSKSLFPEHFKAMTIHRFLGSEIDYDDLGEAVYNFKIPQTRNLPNLIFVDEASMVSKKMFKIFKDIADIVPVVFICDICQIPPVGEIQSEVFSIENRFTFTENMRSRDSLSNYIVQNTRNQVENEDIVFRIPRRTPHSDLYEDFKNDNDTIVLCYTRNSVSIWNSKIRNVLFADKIREDGFLEKYYINEKLVFSGFRIIDPFTKYYSSDIITIRDIEKETVLFNYVECSHNRHTNMIESCDRCGIIGKRRKSIEIGFYKIFDDEKVDWYLAETDDDVVKIKKYCEYYKKYTLKKINLNHSDRKSLWRDYYAIENKYKPILSYTYSSTIHRAQGSQWENIYIDYEDLSCARDEPMLMRRLLYTAASRMMNNVFFIKKNSN